MVRAVGIDPGTKSMDVCGLEDGKVYYEKIVETAKAAQKPETLIEAIESAKPFDLITGPSGYGVEITYLKDIPEHVLEDWYYEYILLITKGGPFYASEVWSLYAYDVAFSTYSGTFQFGYGAALATILVIIGVGASVVYWRLFRFHELMETPRIEAG